jgi:hypothetical protein
VNHQRLAARLIAAQDGEPAHLRFALLDAACDPNRLDANAKAAERLHRRRIKEAAGDDQVRIEGEHFLHRPPGHAIPPRLGKGHRAGARIVAVVRDRQQLIRLGHFGENRVGAGIEADDRWLGGPLDGLHVHAPEQQQGDCGDKNPPRDGEDHSRSLAPMNAPRPGEA